MGIGEAFTKTVGMELTFKIPENQMKAYPKRGSARSKREDIGKCIMSPRDSEESAVVTPGYKRETLLGQVEDRLLRILSVAMLRNLGLFEE